MSLDNTKHQEVVKDAVKPVFGRKKALQSKVIPRYPMSAEREFQRLGRSYVKLLKKSLKNHLPAIMQAYKQNRMDARFDDILTFTKKLRKEMEKIAAELEQVEGGFDLETYIKRIAAITSNKSSAEWKRLVRNTLGINIFEDYYKGSLYREALELWVADNILLIKSIPQNSLGSLEQIILDAYKNGLSMTDLKKAIQDAYNTTEGKTELLARDQMSTLNAQLTKLQQTDAGVTRYKWSTSLDARVRDCHAELHGQIIEWDAPPEMWYDTISKGRVYTGRRCHPGEDIMCRCVAIPIFDWQTLDLPISGEGG